MKEKKCLDYGIPIFKLDEKTVSSDSWHDWRWHIANRIKDINNIKKISSIPNTALYDKVIGKYHFATTPYYFRLIKKFDYTDPVFRQVIPSTEELTVHIKGSDPDPLAEGSHSPLPYLVHRYPDRVLIITTGICASYCRHCNRKRYWDSRPWVINLKQLQRICDYIKTHRQVREVILSGGDPLFLNTNYLETILKKIRGIRHVEIIRIGSRIPVVLPMRITKRLCGMLKKYRPIWLNTHFNHPVELTKEAEHAADMLSLHGIPVSNQTVLLKGVNDSADTLARLFTGLQRILIRPYYLFHCDAVEGTDHFRTALKTGIEIMTTLEGKIGGLCLPKFVVDLPNGQGKAPAGPCFLIRTEDNTAVFRTWEGEIMTYQGANGS